MMIEMMSICINKLQKYSHSSLMLLCFVLAGVTIPTDASSDNTLDRVVAVVEEDVITESELQQRVQNLVQRFSNNPEALPTQDVLMEQILQQLIMERLQLHLAERRGIQIDDLSLDQAMRNLAKHNNLTLEEFRDVVLKQGIDYVEFRNQMRDEMILERLRERIIDKNIEVSKSEVEELVTKSDEDLLKKEFEYHVAQILIAIPETPKPEQIEKAKYRSTLIYERATSGNNFAKLAITSSDAQDALRGGDLGWRNKAQLPPIFLQQIKQMLPGDVSKISQSPAGFHIFKLLEKREIKDTMVTQVLCRHILVSTNALLDNDAAEIKLKEIKSRIEHGEDFGELARKYSEDPGSAINGGMLNWAASNNYVPKFKQVVDSLDVKQISEPFPSLYGWHIVQLLDTRKHDNTQEAMQAEARAQIRQRKIEEETQLWLRELYDESYIENRLHTTQINNF